MLDTRKEKETIIDKMARKKLRTVAEGIDHFNNLSKKNDANYKEATKLRTKEKKLLKKRMRLIYYRCISFWTFIGVVLLSMECFLDVSIGKSFYENSLTILPVFLISLYLSDSDSKDRIKTDYWEYMIDFSVISRKLNSVIGVLLAITACLMAVSFEMSSLLLVGITICGYAITAKELLKNITSSK